MAQYHDRSVARTLGNALFAWAALVAASAAAADDFQVLVFSKTSGFRHGSIAAGTALIEDLGATHGFGVDSTEDGAAFNAANLSQYAAVVWLSTTGNVLDDAQQAAFEDYIRAGGGYVGIHAATDTEYDWPWYGGLIGGDAWFQNHPQIQDATLNVADATHVSTQHYPPTFELRDEWYNFRNDPTPVVNVLVTIDETSYSGGTMGPDHPISWNHEYDGGRAWYTAMGHRDQTFADPDFQTHLLGGILWSAGASDSAAVPAPGAWGLPLLGALLTYLGLRAARTRRRPSSD
ncbi:MAG: ThuA domain-containing protein [Pseudomonadota bacterium]